MNLTIIDERTIAFAGLVQACAQVQSLARNGTTDATAKNAVVQSILVLDAVNTPAVYGGVEGLHLGLDLVADGLLTSPEPNKVEVLRYGMTLLHLQNQLLRDRENYQNFSTAIERLSAVETDELYQACSEIYQQYISNMRPQIIVQGEQEFLQKEEIPPQVRTLLLAGIRAAVLWQQKGGGRFTLIWQRTRMQNSAKRLLKETPLH